MAAYMTISSRYPSWKEYYLSKGKGTKGFLEETMKFDDSLASSAPFALVDDPFAFLKLIDLFEDKNLLPLPDGENRVNLDSRSLIANHLSDLER